MTGPQSRPQDYSDQQVRDILFGDGTRGPSVREFYLQQTRGRVTFTEGRILGPVASTQNCFGDVMRVLAEAKATIESSLTAAEFAQYQQLVFTLPFHSPGNQCGWSFGTPQQPVDFFGASRIMGVSWVIENTPENSFAGLLAHELGHAVGLNHASGLEALNDPLKLKQIPMTLHQYYDFRNIMGGTDIDGASLNAVQLERLDALAGRQTLVTQQPGDYTLKSLDSDWTASDVVHLKLPMTLGDGVFFLRPFLSVEFRTLSTPASKGLYIRTSNLASQSALFFWNGAASILTAPGQAFTDENNGRRITLLALDATTARVRIEAIPQVGLPPVEQLTIAPVDLNTTQGCRTLKVRFRAPATSGLQVSGIEERPYPNGRWLNGCAFRPTNPATNEYGCEIPMLNDPPYQDLYMTMSKSTPMPDYGANAVLSQQQFYPIGSWSCR